jgi:hypothetical protein
VAPVSRAVETDRPIYGTIGQIQLGETVRPLEPTTVGGEVLAGQQMGNMPHRSQPISISRKPLEAVPHVVQRDPRLGLITRRSRVQKSTTRRPSGVAVSARTGRRRVSGLSVKVAGCRGASLGLVVARSQAIHLFGPR